MVPWIWLLDEDAARFGEALPEAVEPEPMAGPDAVHEALVQAANVQLSTIVVIGWSPHLLPMLAADPVLSHRRLVWLLRPERLRLLADSLGGDEQVPGLLVAVCSESEHILAAIRPLHWAFAPVVLEGGRKVHDLLRTYRQDNFFRTEPSIERKLSDLRRMGLRHARIGEAVPLSHWKDRWKGQTALCLAAGPSLEKHIDFVRRFMDRCVVIVVDLVAAKLADNGIKVDFVLNVDPAPSLVQRCRRPADPHTVLIADISAHEGYDDLFPNRSFHGGGEGAASHLLADPAYFVHGTNVGSSTIGWALFLGCDEIVLVGHDLSFPVDQYYSSFVQDGGSHEQQQRTVVGKFSPIAGNDGIEVQTIYHFRVAIDDLAMMFRYHPHATYRNRNLGHRMGALIPGTVEVPQGWEPRSSAALPRPDPSVRLGAPAGSGPLRAALLAAADRLIAHWRAERAAGVPALELRDRIAEDPSLTMGWDVLRPFVEAHLTNLIRYSARPPAERIAPSMRVTEAAIDDLLGRGRAVLAKALAEDGGLEDCPQPPYDERQKAFFAALTQRVPVLSADGLDHAALPFVAREWRLLRMLMPDFALPPFHDGSEAIILTAQIGDRTPPEAMADMLCWCQSDPDNLGYAVVMAHEHGLLSEARVDPSTLLGPLAGARHPALSAVAAWGRALTAGIPEIEDLRAMAAWAPQQPRVVGWLLKDRSATDPHVEMLGGLVRDGSLEIDDQLAGVVIAHHPDTAMALDLLQPAEARLGEVATFALARRHADLGDYTQAIALAERLSSISLLAEDALVLMVRCRLMRDDLAGAQEALVRAPCRGLMHRVWFRCLAEVVGPARAVCEIAAQQDAVLPVGMLADAMGSLAGDIAPELRQPVEEGLRSLIGRGRAAADPEDDGLLQRWEAIAQACEALGRYWRKPPA